MLVLNNNGVLSFMFYVLPGVWSLGDRTTSIELDIPTLTESQMAALEEEVNACIFRCIPVTPIVYHDKHDPDLKQVCITMHTSDTYSIP